MAIRIRHESPLALVGQVAQQTGQGQLAQRAQDVARQEDQFDAQLAQRQYEFDANLATDALNRAQQQQARAADYQMAQDRMAQDAYLRQQAMAADAYGQQQQQQFALDRMAFGADLQYQQQAALSLDEEIKEATKQAQQLNLNPEGKLVLNRLMGDLRQIRGQRGEIRQGAYQDLLNQWYGDFQEAGLDAYEVQEPTVEEEYFRSLMPLDGQQIMPGQPLPPGRYARKKGERNGVVAWEDVEVGGEPKVLTAQERLESSRAVMEDGTVAIWNDDKKEWTFPPKPAAKQEQEGPDYSQLYKDAVKRIMDSTPDYDANDNPVTPDLSPENIVKEIQKYQEVMAKLQGQQGSSQQTLGELNEQFSDPQVQQQVKEVAERVAAGGIGRADAASPDEIQLLGAGTQDDPHTFPPNTPDNVVVQIVQTAEPGTVFVNPVDGSLWVK